MQSNLDILQGVSLQNQRENEQLIASAERSQKDAGKLKVLTQISTMYLPATFVAVFWKNRVYNMSKY